MRLIDADRLKRQVEGRSWRAKGKMVELIDDSPTIRVGENTCKHRTPDGVCKLYTDDEVTSYCVDGPCPNEEPIPEDETSDVKHGRWVIKDNPGTGWYRVTCSECGEDVTSTVPVIGFFPNAKVVWDYCPNCGAKMNTEEGEAHEQN